MSTYSDRNTAHNRFLLTPVGGVTIIEFALGAMLFFSLISAIIDGARYFAIKTVLTKGAQQGLAVAKTLADFGLDPAIDHDKFMAARAVVENATLQIPLSTYVTGADADSMAQLYQGWNSYDATRIFQAIVLRPGDSMQVDSNRNGAEDPSDEWINHPTVCDPHVASCAHPPPAGSTLQSLLLSQPIVVELHSQMQTLTLGLIVPSLRTINVVGRAVGFRELYDRPNIPAPSSAPLPGGGGGGQPPCGGPPPTCNEPLVRSCIGQCCICVPHSVGT